MGSFPFALSEVEGHFCGSTSSPRTETNPLPKRLTISPIEALKAEMLGEWIQKETVVLPGVFNGATALAAKKAGFKALYLSGGALSASLGFPDVGILTLDELKTAVGYIRRATALPVLSDADTGFDDPAKTVRVLEKAGAAGLHIEDQVPAKMCGHLDGKQLVSTKEMVSRIQAAIRGKKSPNFILMARTDARGVEGLDQAIERAKAYVKAGADALFPEGLETKEEFQLFSKAFPKVPLLANMTEFGKTPYISVHEFSEMGYKMVIFPVTLFRLSMKASIEGLMTIRDKGTQKSLEDHFQTRKELYEMLDYQKYVDQNS